MSESISVKEVPVETIVQIHAMIPKFEKAYPTEHFEQRYANKKRLLLAAFINDVPAGYYVGYDRYEDDSWYCWMTGVTPTCRRKGVLKALMQYQDVWVKKHGYTSIKIKTRNNRREMLAYLIAQDFDCIELETKADARDNRLFFERRV